MDPPPTNRTVFMLIVLSVVMLIVVTIAVGAIGVGLFVAGWGLGWLTAS